MEKIASLACNLLRCLSSRHLSHLYMAEFLCAYKDYEKICTQGSSYNEIYNVQCFIETFLAFFFSFELVVLGSE